MFEQVRNLRFINRFGEEVARQRRCYRYRNRTGGVAPLEVKLRIDGCFGLSPLMTFLICMLGADESYAQAAEKLEAVLGFKVSATALQRTTEKTGERIPDDPTAPIDEQCQRQPCPLIVVEVDGGRARRSRSRKGLLVESVYGRRPATRECNLVVIEKHSGAKVVDRWIGARYGPRQKFAEYAERRTADGLPGSSTNAVPR